MAILGRAGYQLNGIDLTPYIKNRLMTWFKLNEYKVGKLVYGDFLHYKKINKYDLVCSFVFVEHFINYKEVILKHAKLVKDGGTVIITCPNFKGRVQNLLHFNIDKKNYLRHNIESMNPTEWSNILIKEGFEVSTVGYFGVFDFWIEFTAKNFFTKILSILIRIFSMILRSVLVYDFESTSPYIGIVAKKKRISE